LANQGKCKIPQIPHDAPEMMAFIKDEEPIECGPEEDWISCYLSKCTIKKHMIDEKGGQITCEFTDIKRKSDYKFEYGTSTKTTSSYILQASDFARVKCKASNGDR